MIRENRIATLGAMLALGLPAAALADGQAEYAKERGWQAPVTDHWTGRLLFEIGRAHV